MIMITKYIPKLKTEGRAPDLQKMQNNIRN